MVVLILSRMHFVGELLAEALHTKGDLIVFQECAPGAIHATARDIMPDAVVVDSTHPDGFAFTVAIRTQFPSVSLVVIGATDNERDFLAWANAGISSYVASETPLDELIVIIRRSAAGEVFCPPRPTVPVRAGVHTLTRREGEVLELLADGLSNKLIALRLQIAEATVKNHVHRILDKWDLSSRGEAAARYRTACLDPSTDRHNRGAGRAGWPSRAPVALHRQLRGPPPYRAPELDHPVKRWFG